MREIKMTTDIDIDVVVLVKVGTIGNIARAIIVDAVKGLEESM